MVGSMTRSSSQKANQSMRWILSKEFLEALTRLTANETKATLNAVNALQNKKSGKGLSLHRIDVSKDPHFWSVRVTRDIRIILHKMGDNTLFAYADHHDKAYAWAERHRVEEHPTTGAMQIVEMRERVQIAPISDSGKNGGSKALPLLFRKLDRAAMLSVGVPVDWVDTVLGATDDDFLDIAKHLPEEAFEALLSYATSGRFPESGLTISSEGRPSLPEGQQPPDPYAHPDAQRRIRIVSDQEELRQALEYPWDRWSVFLHPSQRAVVEKRFAGPARVSGSAGTGKTIVAVHRAVRLARADPDACVLLTTFSDPLANLLQQKLNVLASATGSIVPRIKVKDWNSEAEELFQLVYGFRPRIVAAQSLRQIIEAAAGAESLRGFTARFLLTEWTNVIDAWGVESVESYATAPRLGRRRPLGPKQREKLWPLFAKVKSQLLASKLYTRADISRLVAAHYDINERKPYDYVVVDEAQDLAPPDLAFLSSIKSKGPDSLFFAGDLGQRTYQSPFSWSAMNIDIRGRSSTLKVCYRTSRQIRSAADRLLPPEFQDLDGVKETRSGTISVFEGPKPDIALLPSSDAETARVAAFLANAVRDGVSPRDIGIFVRTPEAIGRARDAARSAGILDHATIAVMHIAKGLEFRTVSVMACDESILPLSDRIAEAADEGELDDIYETERQLLYVACTRARDRLLVTGVAPGSEFLKDLG